MDKQILKKYIVRVKFLLRKQYKNQESCVNYSRRCKNIIEFNKEYIKDLKSIDDKIKNIFTLKDIKEIENNNKELEENILNTKEKLGEINKEIYDYGNMILDISNYIDKYFNLQEKIHLICSIYLSFLPPINLVFKSSSKVKIPLNFDFYKLI
jgi:septal ring factor EnvC (AmiA/AmiB activator)